MLKRLLKKLTPQVTPAKSNGVALVRKWELSPAASLGSAVRIKGIERELRAHLPFPARKSVRVAAGLVTLRMDENDAAFNEASARVSRALEDIEKLPVLPREIEDILTIAPRERLKWLKDGRLQSLGTRTVKMRGRSRKVTFHVYDPQHVEDVLSRDLAEVWREEDALETARNRKLGAGKAALTRAGKGVAKKAARRSKTLNHDAPLEGWLEFEAEGLLR
jgi:hypothetical protein